MDKLNVCCATLLNPTILTPPHPHTYAHTHTHTHTPQGITTYYSQNCAQCDAEFVQKFMQEKDISPFNTRLFKTTTDGGTAQYELRMASAAPVTGACVY